MDASTFREAVFQIHQQGRERGHYFLEANDERFADRHVTIEGRRMLSFGSCSYLGLEFDDRLVAGAIDAVTRYRSQTSYSRGYLSCPLYGELEEELLPALFGVDRVLLLPSTSTAHHVALPALVDERDAVVLDHQVHRSVDDAVTLQCARSGAHKVVVRHGQLEQVHEVIETLARLHRRVWFFCDGVYSMYGDHLPSEFVDAVMAIAPNVHLYVDDAHGMSWAGRHGRGHFLARRELDERTVVVTSLAKAFATGGGVIVARDRALVELARLVGGPFSFSGPLRPADLGASCASARLHLSDKLEGLQRQLARRVALANRLCRELSVPLLVESQSPILFIALGRAQTVFCMAERLRDEGFHVNVSGFPAVPASRGGLRVAINAIHDEAQITALFEAIASYLPSVLAEVGVTRAELDEQFRGALPTFLRGTDLFDRARRAIHAVPEQVHARHHTELSVARAESIRELDTETWDRLFGGLAYVEAASMRAAEEVFNPRAQRSPEYQWTYRYLFVEHQDRIVAAAPLTAALIKDDMFMSAGVSRALERRRRDDPHLFCSRALTTGTMASEGLHVYLDDGPLRTQALVRLLDEAVAEAERLDCRTLVFGNFPEPDELAPVFTAHGFVPMRLLDAHVLHLDWHGEDEFIRRLSSRSKRRHVRDIHAQADRFRCEVWDASTDVDDAALAHLHALYLGLARKNMRINIFPLPPRILRAHLRSGLWELLVLRDSQRDRAAPVAFVAGCRVNDEQRWLYCGVDYDGYDLERTSPYRQLLWEMIRHPAKRGAARVHIGMGADQEKLKFGTTPVPTYAFVRTNDDYQAAKLQELVEALATGRQRA